MNKIKQKFLYSGISITFFFLIFSFLVVKVFAQTSSCQHISGGGPIRVVFLNSNLTDSQFVEYINVGIGSFKKTDPFKKYFDRFSFYYPKNDPTACDNIGSSLVVKLDIGPGRSYAIFSYLNVYLKKDQSTFNTKEFIQSLISHESGHILGGLNDEYIDQGEDPRSLRLSNCSLKNTGFDYKSSLDQKLYGLPDIKGCLYRDDKYFRPSENSIMNNNTLGGGDKFNVISCGYLVAGLRGESTTESNAEKYWPECCGLDTIKDGVEGCNPSTFSIEIPKESTCSTDTFTNTYTEEPLPYDIILTAPEDIQLPTIIDEDNFFKINGKDVSVPDDNGGRKIPKGEVITISANTEKKYEILDNYCRDGEISFSLDEKFVDLQSPFECFYNCE